MEFYNILKIKDIEVLKIFYLSFNYFFRRNRNLVVILLFLIKFMLLSFLDNFIK